MGKQASNNFSENGADKEPTSAIFSSRRQMSKLSPSPAAVTKQTSNQNKRTIIVPKADIVKQPHELQSHAPRIGEGLIGVNVNRQNSNKKRVSTVSSVVLKPRKESDAIPEDNVYPAYSNKHS